MVIFDGHSSIWAVSKAEVSLGFVWKPLLFLILMTYQAIFHQHEELLQKAHTFQLLGFE